MEERSSKFTDNIQTLAISRQTAVQLQQGREIVTAAPKVRQSRMARNTSKTITVDKDVWETAKQRAEKIAVYIVADEIAGSRANATTLARKVRQTASNLIVVDKIERSVTVYNTVAQASQARKSPSNA